MTNRWVRDHPPSSARRRLARGLRGHAAVGALGVLTLALLVTWLTLDGPSTEPFGTLPPQPSHASTDDVASVQPFVRAAPGDAVQPTASATPDAGIGLPADPAAAAAGLSPADLIALRAELTAHPRGEAELRRVLAYLTYQQQWQRFESQRRAGTDTAALRPLAVALDAALAERWQQGELGGAQALQIKAQLLEVLLDDAASRRNALAEWQARLGIGAPAAAATHQAALDQAKGDRR